MGEVLAELEQALRSNNKDKITLEEELVLQKCKARAVNTFLTSAGISSVLIWGATRNRFSTISRTSFSIGAALVLGGWTFDRSLNSSVRSILSAHGTRMQSELAKIVMMQNLQNPASPISKIFYAEHVYDDSSQDKPLIRWRPRRFYEDTVVADSPEVKDTPSSKGPASDPKQQSRNSSGETITGLGDLITDPLDCILGYPEAGIETRHSDTSSVVSRREIRAHKRRQRRHHAQNNKNSPSHTTSEVLIV